ncbi:MAG: hypothetical protein K0B81_05705 [Candidatus Cloacimonetes bacterium]|nr:hypothetical protein [Candidatus Cloacimonadota bacterium]
MYKNLCPRVKKSKNFSFCKRVRTNRQFLIIATISLLSLILTLGSWGCSYSADRQIRRIPQEMREILTLSLPFTPVKIAYSSLDNSLYVMEPETNMIRIYRDGKYINAVGGLGFSDSNFNRLSDITVSPHGRLLALDSFQKQIKRFDSNGMWIENFHLKNIGEPVLFDVSHDGMVFVYDRTSNEIVILDEKMENIVYRFGKFVFREPVQLHSTFTHVTVYDRSLNTTFIFDNFGKLTEELSGYWQIDRFNNKYRLDVNKISHPATNKEFLLYHKPWSSFYVKSGIIGLITDREIKISEMTYERYQ